MRFRKLKGIKETYEEMRNTQKESYQEKKKKDAENNRGKNETE